jgi:hypothetical protein
VIWAFLLPQVAKIMAGLTQGKIESIKNLLKRKPWMRYMILGFFRRERPDDSVIIPEETVSQLLITKGGGILGRGEYLIVVEGEKMTRGFMNRFRSWFRMLVFPFYWERTVHILRLPRDANAKQTIIDTVSSILKKQAENWK